ncbi:hypothetical protein ERC79_13995 [Rhodococcus sp. ABRD24]|uniref:hypothetical protein n=1 Tax=Rhodococcus sp. ABRD24 TaxID=2507582 RepID=UPI00103F3288|nr:hypothetical protein [Rhodococcus sp. ABRD24]QBJ96939.1 hypothetical protein ERC79_13995 [Rhodococcus sp. ABRD24]
MSTSDSGWPATVRYAFLVGGELSERVLAAFPELRVSESARAHTTLYGPVRSPTELRGMIARFDSLGLTLVEMRQLPD